MFENLKSLLENSYSPYSKFRVSAIIVTNDGKTFKGVNIENASYGATICAERTAFVSAIANGYKKGDFKELHILCGDSNKISTCCYICRQFLVEFCDKYMPVICYDKSGNKEQFNVFELCTYPFEEMIYNKIRGI